MPQNRFAIGLTSALALCIGACAKTNSTANAPATKINRDELKSSSAAPVLPSDYQQRVKDYLSRNVAVPSTASYIFEPPYMASVVADKYGSRTMGWAVPVRVDVQDRLGREVPPSTQLFFFYPNGSMIEVAADHLQVVP